MDMNNAQSTLSEAVAHIRQVESWAGRNHRFKPVDVPLAMLLALVDAKGEALSLKHLYSLMPCSMPTAVKWVKRLLALGWVETADPRADRRVHRIRLTLAGEAFLLEYYATQTGRIAQRSAA